MNCEAVAWALAQSRPTLSSSAKFLLVAIASRMEGDTLLASQKELAEIVRLGDRQVRTLLKELAELGLIKRTRRGGNGAGRLADAISLVIGQPADIATSEQLENIAVATGKLRRSIRKTSPQQPEIISAQQEEISPAYSVDNSPRVSISTGARAQNITLNTSSLELYPETVELVVVAPEKVLNGSARGMPAQQLAEVLAARANSSFLDPSRVDGLRTTCGRIHRWMEAGADFDADILPTVVRLMTSKRSPVRSWGYFDDAIREATAKRLASEAPMEIITAHEARPNDQRDRYAADQGTYTRRKRSRHIDALFADEPEGPPVSLGRLDFSTGK